MQCFVSSCFTACSTGVSQPFTCSAPVLCRGHSVINTLILQMETRIGKCPAPTDSCHAMPVHSAGAQLLRGADMAVNSASQPLSPWCLQFSHPWNKGRYMWPRLASALWFLGRGPCKAQLWLYWRCAHSTTPALCPWQRSLWAPQMSHGMVQLRKTAALKVLLHYLPKFLFCTCTGAFFDTDTMVKVDCQRESGGFLVDFFCLFGLFVRFVLFVLGSLFCLVWFLGVFWVFF